MNLISKNCSARWRSSWLEFRVAYVAIIAVLLLLVGYLALGQKPWISGVMAETARGGKLRPEHYVASGLWYGALINVAIAIGLAVAGPWLFRRLPNSMPAPATIAANRREKNVLLWSLVLATILSGWIQAPRLSTSLWGDEEYTAKRFVAGYYRRDAEGKMELKEPEWQWTLWDFRRGPANHQLFSVLSRMSHSFHDPSQNPKKLYFSEKLIRLPSYLASLGTVFAVGWLAALLGGVRAGAIAGFLIAIHPWFIRYGPEARGYALLMLLLTLSFILLYKAATGGRWRHWLGYGLVEFLCFISYFGSFYFIVLINFSGLLLIWLAQADKFARRAQLGRFVVTNTMAVTLVVMMVAPAVEPVLQWLKRTSESAAFGAPPDLRWVTDAVCELATGLPWNSWDASNPLALHLSAMPQSLSVSLLVLTTVLAMLGIIRLFTGSRMLRILTLPMILTAPLMVVHAVSAESFLFSWYLLVALPPLMVAIAIGIGWIGEIAATNRRKTCVCAALAALFMGLLVTTTWERVRLLRTRAVEPLYESVALTRDVLNPADAGIDENVITVGFSMWTEGYDPAARSVHNAAELRAAIDEARASGRKLYLNFGQYQLAKLVTPDIMELVEDESLFEQVAVLHGLWQPCTRWIYRAKIGGHQKTIAVENNNRQIQH